MLLWRILVISKYTCKNRNHTGLQDIKEYFELAPDPANAAVARARLREAAKYADFSGTRLEDFEVAFGEALSNAILYGCPGTNSHISVCITFNYRTCEFAAEITDQGPGFDLHATRRPATEEEVRGRGLKMMAALVDKVIMYHNGTGLTVRLIHNLNSHHLPLPPIH